MRLYFELGRRAAALRQYQQCVVVLQREIGAEPEAETRQLYEEILRERSAPRGVESVGLATGHRLVRWSLSSSAPLSVTPMVGREVEKERLRGPCSTGRWVAGARLVIVRGEAGIGKTRLVVDLAACAAGRGARVLFGRSSQSEQILPFGPWVDAIRAGHVTDAATYVTVSIRSGAASWPGCFPSSGPPR